MHGALDHPPASVAVMQIVSVRASILRRVPELVGDNPPRFVLLTHPLALGALEAATAPALVIFTQ